MIIPFKSMIDLVNWQITALIVSMLLINLLFGCASTAQVEPNNTTNNDSAAALEQPSATPSHTSPMPTATLTTTATPPPTSSATPTPTATATVTLVPTTQPTATPQPPTSTPSPTSTSAPNPTPTPLTEAGPLSESSAEQGLAVYRGQYCGICHQLDAAGTTGLFGPSHNGIGSTAAQHIQDPGYTGTATTAAEYIRESILNPAIYRVPGFEYSPHPMPAYTHLTQMEVDALVQFLLQQK